MSIFDHPDDVPTVPTWRCPHCATLQPESTRCWACDLSPMTCATCRYFRRSVIGAVGLCGLDRTRSLLAGDEVRSCWQAPTDLVDLVSDRPGSGRTSWLTLAERQRAPAAEPSAPTTAPEKPTTAPEKPTTATEKPAATAMADPTRPEADDLVEAPLVEPARRVTTEAQRRARARRERRRSADDLEGVD